MKKLESKRVSIPLIYLIENDKELKDMPLGIPFIRANVKDYDKYIQLLEFEVLLKSALATGFPFNWEELLKKNGFKDFKREIASSVFTLEGEGSSFFEKEHSIKDHLIDISYQVDIEVIKNLKILPTWFSDIESAVKENILNSIVYNPNLYNKKLDLCSGGVDLHSPDKNLIIIDISGSIPTSISEAILLLSKTMASQFYADLLITGSKSTLYDYTEMDRLDVSSIYRKNGKDNDQTYFKNLVKDYKKYNTAIIFGDNHSPCMIWENNYNKNVKAITVTEGKKLNKWDIKQIYSFHTTSDTTLAGYGDWFDVPEEKVTHIKKWAIELK